MKRTIQRMKAFPYIFFHSLADIPYYNRILKTPLSFSFKYFFVLATLVSLITSLTITIKISPEIKKSLNQSLTIIKTTYPQDLVITSKNNQWSVNKPEPVAIPMPFGQTPKIPNFPSNIIVFLKNGTVDDVQKLNTLVLVNEKNILVQSGNTDENGKYTSKLETYPIQNIPDGTFDYNSLIKAIENIQKLGGLIEFVIIGLLSVFIWFYNCIFRLIYLLIVGTFIWLVSLAVGTKYKFGESYRIAIHTLTLPSLIDLMLATTDINFPFPFWFLSLNLIYACVVVIVLAKSKKAEEQVSSTTV
jgi:hypothetical protein